MNKEQQNTLSAYYNERNVCEKYKNVWQKDEPFTESYGLFILQIPKIEQYRDAQVETSESTTASKKELRSEIASDGAFMAIRLKRFAYKTNDTELAKSVDYSEWDLRKATDNELVGICNLLISKATANIEKLTTYSITKELFDTFKTQVTGFTAMIAKPLSAESQSKNATLTLEKLFKETDSILAKGLDLDIEVFKKTAPDFYNEFQSARKVNKAASSITALRAKALDKGTGKALKSVIFTFAKHVNGSSLSAISTNGTKITKKQPIKATSGSITWQKEFMM